MRGIFSVIIDPIIDKKAQLTQR